MQFPNLIERLRMSLVEDSAFSDITTRQLPRFQKQVIHANVIAKEKGIYCGAFLLKPLFRLMDPKAEIELVKKDGQAITPGQILARLKATVSALLGGERVFLTKTAHLSGIATLTNTFVKAVRGTPAKIYDTRKTTPLWRDLEKYAVRCGGGVNHRMSLGDAVLVKDNHIQYLRSQGLLLTDAFGGRGSKRLKVKGSRFFEVEAQSYQDVWEAIKCGADYIMLDNMPYEKLKGAIALIQAARRAKKSSFPQIEISGGVTLKNVRRYAELGVERISVGAITHSALSLDISMEVD